MKRKAGSAGVSEHLRVSAGGVQLLAALRAPSGRVHGRFHGRFIGYTERHRTHTSPVRCAHCQGSGRGRGGRGAPCRYRVLLFRISTITGIRSHQRNARALPAHSQTTHVKRVRSSRSSPQRASGGGGRCAAPAGQASTCAG